MGALTDALAGKVAGDLIRADDWNALVEAVEEIEESLRSEITTVSERVETGLAELTSTTESLEARLGAVEAETASVRSAVDTLRGQLRRVTLRTSRNRFAIGELAEITARITDLDGEPLELADPATRPWIDFVAVWGQLKPVPGFQSMGGVGDRTIAVRVNAQGEARVLLRAEHADGLTDEIEAQVAGSLTTTLPAQGVTVANAILNANTPMEALALGAFNVMTAEYKRADTPGVRNFADAYYARNAMQVSHRFAPVLNHLWRDYRSTVLAFAKTDNDPSTPDPALGTCSIQITFRDWLGPWIELDFMAALPSVTDDYHGILVGQITTDFVASNNRIKSAVVNILDGKGLIAKQLDYQALKLATDRIQLADGPPFLSTLKQNISLGIATQQALEYGQAAAIGLGQQPVAFEAFANAGGRTEESALEMAARVSEQVGQQVAAVEDQVTFQVRQQQASFRDELLREDGVLLNLQRNVSAVQGEMHGFLTALEGKADVESLVQFLR